MAAYVIGEIRITDPARYETYVPAALASIVQYGGRLGSSRGRAFLVEGM